jgi:mevalonate kinase
VVPSLSKDVVTASAPAKVILFGEHFVVYGEPAVVLAIDKRVFATVQLRKDDRIYVSSSDMRISGTFRGGKFQAEKGGSEARVKLEPTRSAVQQVLTKAQKKAGVNVKIKSDVPVSAGLGSSAAVATSTIVAVSNLLGTELSREQIFQMAYESERVVHGTPSGIDPAVSTYGGMLEFQKGKDFIPLNIETEVPLIIGNTKLQRSTGELVASVRRMKEHYPAIIDPLIQIGGKIALGAVGALRNNNLQAVGDLMNINHAILGAVGASHESLERLVYAARKGGAFGAKLTGGGGCMIALAEKRKLKRVCTAIERVGGTAFEARKTDEGARVES